jgi:AcrR family transcriptional regulator
MPAGKLSDARAELVRQRVLGGVAEVIERGEALTFANVAAAGGVPERTLYRHFPTREALLAAVFELVNERVGFHGDAPTDRAGLSQLVRRVFPGFDAVAPVIHELLIAPEGRLVRLASKPARQRAALELVRNELGELERTQARRIAAVLQLLTAAATWQTLRDYWDMDGAEAAETAALAIELLLAGARARDERGAKPDRSTRARTRKRTGA